MKNYSELCNYIDYLSDDERQELLHNTIEQINKLKLEIKESGGSEVTAEHADIKKLSILLSKTYFGTKFHQGCAAILCSNNPENYYWDSFEETVFKNLTLLSIENDEKGPVVFIGKKRLMDDYGIYTKNWDFGYRARFAKDGDYFLAYSCGSNSNVENRYGFDQDGLVQKRIMYRRFDGVNSLGHKICDSSADMTVERDANDPLKVKIRNEANFDGKIIKSEKSEGFILSDAWFDIDSKNPLTLDRYNAIQSLESAPVSQTQLGMQFPDLANTFNRKLNEKASHK